MRKLISFIMAVAVVFSVGGLAACDNDPPPSDDSVTSVVILGTGISGGAITKYMASGMTFSLAVNVTVTGAAATSVTWDSNDKTVATVSGGTVTLIKAGTTNITATSTADSTKSGTLALTVVDNRNTPIVYPEGEFVKPLDKDGLSYNINSGIGSAASLAVTYEDNVTLLTYNAEAAASDWQSYARCYLPEGDYERATQLGVNISCVPSATVYLKLIGEGGKKIWEGEVSGTSAWATEVKNFSQMERAGLSGLSEMYVYVPKPGTMTTGGVVKISGIWLNGDAAPSSVPAFAFNEENIVARLDAAAPRSGDIKQSGTVSGTDGKLSVTFSAPEHKYTLTNTGYNNWKSMLYDFPTTTDYSGAAVDYTEASWVVFDITDISGGPFIKFKILDEGLREIYPVEGTRYYAAYYFDTDLQDLAEYYATSGIYMQVSPSYLAEGASSAAFTLNGIYIMK